MNLSARIPQRRAGIESRQFMGAFIVWKKSTRARKAIRLERGLALLWALIDGKRSVEDIAVILNSQTRVTITAEETYGRLTALKEQGLVKILRRTGAKT